MAAVVVQASFSAGELSPHLFGRVDLNKYKIGAAKMENFLVDYRGGAGKRPGTRFVGKCKYNTTLDVTLIPFQFSTEQTYVIELGHLYMRLITNGGYVINPTTGNIYEIVTPWHAVDLVKLKYTQSADIVTIVHSKYPTYELVRRGHTDWIVRAFTVKATIEPPYQVNLSLTSSGFIDGNAAVYVNYGYGITAVGPDGAESLMGPLVKAYSVLDMSAHKVTAQLSWTQVAGAEYYNVYKATVGVQAQITAGSRMGFVGSTRVNSFTDSNILPNYSRPPPVHFDPFTPGQITEVQMTLNGTGYDDSAYIIVQDPTGGGAAIYPQVANTSVMGADVVFGGTNYSQTPTLIFTGNHNTLATGNAIVGPKTGTYPSAVAYFQQRLLFAATANRPSTLWGSKPGSFHNFDYGIPINDGDSFEFTLSSQQVNAIKYMLPMPGGLVILTTGGAWQLSGTQQFAPVTPTQMMATPQAFNGCGDLQPIVIGYEILFIQTAGSVVRNLSYNFFANIYTGADVTVLSNHLFAGYSMKAWSYAEEPDKVIWTVRSDGKLLSFTFLKEQEVAGWSNHSTQGQFIATATVREGLRDVTYFAVNRYNPALGWYTAIEQLQPRHMRGGVEDAWFLDCALTLPQLPQQGVLYSSGVRKKDMIFQADTAVFSATWVSWILRAAGGKYRITAFVNGNTVIADEINEVQETWLDEEAQVRLMVPQKSMSWSVSPEFTSVGGLGHLEGVKVSVFVDGDMQSDKVVTGGSVALDSKGSKIVIGLGYEADLQTLRLESQPSIQTRRKKIPALTVRVADTRGLWAGMTFETLTEIKERPPGQLSTIATPLIDGDLRIVMDPLWDAEGQVCIRSVNGLPANIIAVIPETVLGDT